MYSGHVATFRTSTSEVQGQMGELQIISCAVPVEETGIVWEILSKKEIQNLRTTV